VALNELSSEVLICFAVKEEAAEFKKVLPSLASLGNPEILVTGMGRRNSERMILKRLERPAPNLVVTCGFAGALNPTLKIGDVAFDEDTNGRLADTLKKSGALSANFYCAPRVATTVAEKTGLRQSTGADVVEMESAIIREICRAKKIPSATIRVISDTANQDLPLDFNALMTPEQTISFPKLALALMKSPGKIPKLLELQRNTRFASQQLSKVLTDLLRSRSRGV
jgi:adenosylhomocysteine nucleosidase